MIALAGDRRLIAAEGEMLFHQPYITAAEHFSAEKLRGVAERIDMMAANMAQIIAARASVSRDTAKSWIAAGKRFTAAAAIAAGICDGYLSDPLRKVVPPHDGRLIRKTRR